jgi:hypothetical protein
MSLNTEYFSTWEVLEFDSGTTRRIVNSMSTEHPLKTLSEKINYPDQRWTLLWFVKVDSEVSEHTVRILADSLKQH